MLESAGSRNEGEAARSAGEGHGPPATVAGPEGQTAPTMAHPHVPAHPYGRRGPYEGASLDAPVDLHAKFVEYWRLLYRRKWLIVGLTAACMGIGLVRTLLMVPLYSATTRLQIDRTESRVIEGGSTSPQMATSADAVDFLKTQFEVLQSRAIAERASTSLKLEVNEGFMKLRAFSIVETMAKVMPFTGGLAAPRAADQTPVEKAARVVLENRSIKPVANARLVDIIYHDPNPRLAQAISGALAQAYITANLDKRFEANAHAKTFLDDQLKQLKLRLEEADKALIAFSEREQMVIVTEKSSIAENNLAAANSALGVLVSERIKNEQFWKQVANADAISLPQFLTNTVIAGFRDRRNLLVTEYQEKLQTFKPGYPAMQEIGSKIKEIDRQLAAEVTTIRNSLKAAYENSVNQEEEMKQRIHALRGEVLELQRRSLQYNLLKRDVDSTKSLYDGLLQRYKEVDVAGGMGANNVYIVDRPELPRFPSSPNLTNALAMAMVFGLLGGILVAFVLSRLDDTFVSSDEVERVTGLTILGIIPQTQHAQGAEAELSDPQSAISEAYRSLCTALQFATESGLPRALSLTSALASEGKSLTAIAIARHFSMLGLKVLLVDADMRNPSLHKKLGLPNGTGLSNYLTGACRPPEAFQATSSATLTFMCAGPLPPNAADLLSGARLASLVSVGLEVFDFIVVDGPPVMELADAPILTSTVSATIFIVGAGQARPAMVRHALRRLQHARGPIIGAVLTRFNARVAGYGYGYGYGYRSSYGYAYGARGTATKPEAQGPAPAAIGTALSPVGR